MGQDYAGLKLVDSTHGIILQYVECKNALKGSDENIICSVPVASQTLPTPYSNKYMSTTVPQVAPLNYKAADIFFRIKVEPRNRDGDVPDMTATFGYSCDGKQWRKASGNGPTTFVAKPGKWIGAKFGLFCNRLSKKNDSGWMQVDWIEVTE